MNDNISLAMHKFPPRVLGDFGKTDKSARHMEIATGLLVYQFRALNNLPNSRKSIDELESVDISDMICPLRAHGEYHSWGFLVIDADVQAKSSLCVYCPQSGFVEVISSCMFSSDFTVNVV